MKLLELKVSDVDRLVRDVESGERLLRIDFIQELESSCEAYQRDEKRPYMNMPYLYELAIYMTKVKVINKLMRVIDYHNLKDDRYMVRIKQIDNEPNVNDAAYIDGTEIYLYANNMINNIVNSDGFYFTIDIYKQGIIIKTYHPSDDEEYWNQDNVKRIYCFYHIVD